MGLGSEHFCERGVYGMSLEGPVSHAKEQLQDWGLRVYLDWS